MITVVGTLKGGTGKSTVSFNLAIWLATHGFSIEVFDLDPQATFTDVVDVRREDGHLPDLQVSNDIEKLIAKPGVQTIVDVGTADMPAMCKALSLADRVIIPAPPSQADVWSTQRFIEIVAEASKDASPPSLLAFINRADTNPAVRETHETQQALRMLPGLKLVTSKLGQRTTFRRSFSEGLAVFEFEPRGKAADEVNALATVLFSFLFIEG